MRFIWLLALPFLFFSCKTAEEIQREKMVDDISNQAADHTVRLQELEARLGMVSGKVDESSHNTQQKVGNDLKKIQEQLTLLTEQMKSHQDEISSQGSEVKRLSAEVSAHKEFLDQVLKTLENMGSKKLKLKGGKAAKEGSEYDQAMQLYKNGKYKEARSLLQKLVDDSSIKGEKRAKVLHNLGVINFLGKHYDEALVHLSKLYTEFPKSEVNQNGLLVLGRSFAALGQTDKAERTFQELTERFPHSEKAQEAQKDMAKLKAVQ
ncbi:MAG: tetratricopeptide repeat protein [Pseudomonadota bacterium]